MAAWAVEATMLRYQMTIVSSIEGSASCEYLQREVCHCRQVYRRFVCSLVASDVQALDPGVTAIVMATTNIDLNIAVFGAKILNQHKFSHCFPARCVRVCVCVCVCVCVKVTTAYRLVCHN